MSDDVKHYRSTLNPNLTVTSSAAKSARFDHSESWEEYDPATGETVDPQAGFDD